MNPSDFLPQTSPVVLPFRAPVPSPHLADPQTLTHDVAALRRPVPVTRNYAPAMRPEDGVAHDACNLLTSLELFSTMLAEPGVLSPEHSDMGGELHSLVSALSKLVTQLAPAAAPVAPADEAGPVARREPVRPRIRAAYAAPLAVVGAREVGVDAGVAVRACEALLSAVAGPQVALLISAEGRLPALAMGQDELTRVLANLVRNSSEAMPLGGRVTVRVRKALSSTPAVLITVQDTGRGIPPHALGQIFQAGWTSKRAPDAWPGSGHYGLGLTIVRDLVEAAGGSVRVTSGMKKGTTFELKMPCLRG